MIGEGLFKGSMYPYSMGVGLKVTVEEPLAGRSISYIGPSSPSSAEEDVLDSQHSSTGPE